jgi:phosphomannomutase
LWDFQTPAIAETTIFTKADLDIAATASYNPACDNGITFFKGKTKKLPSTRKKK